ncbi:PIN domain-containing protein [Candidatus Micrarchaeota archaeon]|nr:PIN domain-containing protein [Candidatus Micrarchaeota archaeon]
MRVFLDSGAIIAYNRDRDDFHAAASKILDALDEQNTPVCVSNHVVEEVVTFLQAREGPEKAFQVGQGLLQNRQITVLYVNGQQIEKALRLVRRRAGLSLCDALTAVIMEENGIEILCSFDADFDHFRNIKRLH